MRIIIACSLVSAVFLGATVVADDNVDAGSTDPAVLFEQHCALCHAEGDGHPGTMRLADRLGDELSLLLERDDLPAEYIAQIIRQGFQMMPPFRPTEIDPQAVERLARWIAMSAKGNP